MKENEKTNEDKMRLEVMHYLQDNVKHLSNLDKYPIIKKMFLITMFRIQPFHLKLLLSAILT